MKKIILSLLLLVPLVSSAEIKSDLRQGSRGPEVIELQNFLITNKYLAGEATGNYFNLTRKAVTLFQKANSISQTGNVGPVTRAKIKSFLSAKVENVPSSQAISPVALSAPVAPLVPVFYNNLDTNIILQNQVNDLQNQLRQVQQVQNNIAQQALPVQPETKFQLLLLTTRIIDNNFKYSLQTSLPLDLSKIEFSKAPYIYKEPSCAPDSLGNKIPCFPDQYNPEVLPTLVTNSQDLTPRDPGIRGCFGNGERYCYHKKTLFSYRFNLSKDLVDFVPVSNLLQLRVKLTSTNGNVLYTYWKQFQPGDTHLNDISQIEE